MSRQDRTTLKSYFQTGDKPTEDQFADLIDSNLNLRDEGIFDANGDLGLGHDNPVSKLSVNGNVAISPTNDTAPSHGLFVHGKVGVGDGFTNPTAQLAVKGGVYIGNNENTDPGENNLRVDGNINLGGDLNLESTAKLRTAFIRPQSTGGLQLMNAAGAVKLHIDGDNVFFDSNLEVKTKNHITTNTIRSHSDKLTLSTSSEINLDTSKLKVRDKSMIVIKYVELKNFNHTSGNLYEASKIIEGYSTTEYDIFISSWHYIQPVHAIMETQTFSRAYEEVAIGVSPEIMYVPSLSVEEIFDTSPISEKMPYFTYEVHKEKYRIVSWLKPNLHFNNIGFKVPCLLIKRALL